MLGRRNSWRDYVDIYFIIKNRRISLKEVIAKAKNIYRAMFSEKLFLAQLLYTKDIDQKEIKNIKLLNKKVSLGDVKKFFEKEIKGLQK